MVDVTVISDDLPTEETINSGCNLSDPPFDTAFLSLQFADAVDSAIGAIQDDVHVDDFDFSFVDLYIPTGDELDTLLNPTQFSGLGSQLGFDALFPQFVLNVDEFEDLLKSKCSELLHESGDGELTGDRSSDVSGVLNSASYASEKHRIPGYLNVPSLESDGSNRETSENCDNGVNLSDFPSPEFHVSGNCGSHVSDSNNHAARSASYSPCTINRPTRVGLVPQKLKLGEPPKNNVSSLLKRKKDVEPNNSLEPRINKHSNSENDANVEVGDEDEKRKARLVRNRESAQLSRQRNKHYVEELEEKVKMMHSTIQDLNAKISCFMAEIVTLRQQMCGGGAVPPPPMVPPPPGVMYPLVPIPKLEPEQTSKTANVSRTTESKKNVGPKMKKVAGISFLGLLFFIMLFGFLAPMVNIRYGGVRETLTGAENYAGAGLYEKHHGRVLMVNGTEADGKFDKSSIHCGHDSGGNSNVDGSVGSCNESEPPVASLYVPRNDKLVKIDGNLIIHSVLASEKAMSSHKINVGGETGLAVPGGSVPSIPIPGVPKSGARLPHLPAFGSSSVKKDSRIQQWFREGLSGTCTEVFQYDVSPVPSSGAVVSATTTRNISEEQSQNSTHLSKGRYRRILHGRPIPPPDSHNISRPYKGKNSSMAVSVLIDPRKEADVDDVMGKKSLPRIFVVVLIDSVKYVTYSCMISLVRNLLFI